MSTPEGMQTIKMLGQQTDRVGLGKKCFCALVANQSTQLLLLTSLTTEVAITRVRLFLF